MKQTKIQSQETCDHEWSMCYSTAWGLARECRKCGFAKTVEIAE